MCADAPVLPHDYQRYCEDNALQVVEIVPWAGAPEVIADMAGKALRSWPRASNTALRVALGVLTIGITRKLSHMTMEMMPLGYTLVARRTAHGAAFLMRA